MWWCVYIILYTKVICAIAQNYIDIGRTLDENSRVYPLNSPNFINFKLDVVEEGEEGFGGGWFSIKKFCTPEHISTSIDAPFHICKDGWKLNEIPMERFFPEAIVLDISEKAKLNPNAELTLEDMFNWVETHGPVPNGSIVLLRTGWASKYDDHQAYFGYPDPTNVYKGHNFPGFSAEVSDYLIKLKENAGVHVYGIGIDTASFDRGNTKTFAVHTKTCAANMYGIENLYNLEKLPPKGFRLIITPIKLTNGTGAPCRVIADFTKKKNVRQLAKTMRKAPIRRNYESSEEITIKFKGRKKNKKGGKIKKKIKQRVSRRRG